MNARIILLMSLSSKIKHALLNFEDVGKTALSVFVKEIRYMYTDDT
jgi:hypothetical protein